MKRELQYTSPGRFAVLLAVMLIGISLGSLALGASESVGLSETLRGLLAFLGLGEPLSGAQQTIAELRIHKLLTSIGVGAALALSGALFQGVFRNQLASPSIIGVTAGASLGASLMIIVVSGSARGFFMAEGIAGSGPLLISLAAFAGALISTAIVTMFATTAGRISVPTLLLAGIAVNAIVGGGIAAIQRFAVEEADLMRALMTWTFGRLDDRSAYHVVTIWTGLAGAIVLIPRVARELDLFASGEEDAHSLGVNTVRVKAMALVGGALCAALAVSVAGQIAFVGLITPHILRRMCGSSHRHLLWLSLLGGPVLLCGADLIQRLIVGRAALPPGVVMSLLGGPFFLMLLLRNRSSVEAW
ncbi:MAG: iron complex transport system permease protein [Planctomycetota bacterium]|jgi:iron complex transport system permease protein